MGIRGSQIQNQIFKETCLAGSKERKGLVNSTSMLKKFLDLVQLEKYPASALKV
jgi:hypothetical protein